MTIWEIDNKENLRKIAVIDNRKNKTIIRINIKEKMLEWEIFYRRKTEREREKEEKRG